MGLKIAFLTPEYPNPRIKKSGGIGTSIKNLSNELIRQGCEVTLIIYGQDKDDYFEENEICFHVLRNVHIKGFSWYFTRKKIQRVINTLYKKNKIDVVEAVDWTGITSYINTKCPITIRIHGSDTYFCKIENRKVNPFNSYHEKRALLRANGLISVSQFAANKTNDVFNLNLNFSIIHNGINVDLFNPKEKLTNLESPIILYLGTLIRKKGLLELPLIFNKVIEAQPNAKLVLIGNDSKDVITQSSTYELMKPLFSSLALAKVEYLGKVPYETVADYIGKANVCVFPSFAEAFPVSWLEAMAMKKAIVASNIGWAPESIDDSKSGFLVNPKLHDEFASKIIHLIRNVELSASIGEEARNKVVNEFSIEKIALKNIKFYLNLLESKW